jgi:hypothetical protein
VRKAAFLFVQRVADEGMPMDEAGRLYWIDQGLSDVDARAMVAKARRDPPDWRELLD